MNSANYTMSDSCSFCNDKPPFIFLLHVLKTLVHSTGLPCDVGGSHNLRPRRRVERVELPGGDLNGRHLSADL